MRYRALITGASAGLGTEFCRQLVLLGLDVVLVARNVTRLEEFAAQLRELRADAVVELLPADLLDRADVARVVSRLQDTERPIDVLVNNAGFGIGEAFEASAIADELAMQSLLLTVPTELNHAVIPGMLGRGHGWILNVASAAAFVPAGSYSAAKAGLVQLSRSLGARYRARGLVVSALCPGFVHTEFHERMGADKAGVPAALWCDAPTVVREGIRGLRRGRLVTVSDVKYRLLRPLAALIPARVVASQTLPRAIE